MNDSHRRSIRLPSYDYRSSGAYFVTLCTHHMACLFGQINDGAFQPNPYGRIVEEEWLRTAVVRVKVELDAYVVMPDHLHGILVLQDGTETGLDPCPAVFGHSVTTKRINRMRRTPGETVWQRNYYERVVRTEDELNLIRHYIGRNPSNWGAGRGTAPPCPYTPRRLP